MQIKPHFGFDYDCQVANFTINDRDYLVSELQRHKVLRFRNQSVDPDQLAQFSEIFGPIWTNDDNGILSGNGERNSNHPDSHKITLVSNKGNGVLADYLVPWHCDVSHKPWQTKGGTMPFRILYCVKTASDEKSVTKWFDQTYLYDNLSSELRALVERLQICMKAPYETGWDQNIMPFVLTDPVNGRKSVALQSLFFQNFVGLTCDQSLAITRQLFDIALQDDNVIIHEWEVGDLVISNSYNTAHQREKMYTQEERTLWRTTFQIPELVPFEIKPEEF